MAALVCIARVLQPGLYEMNGIQLPIFFVDHLFADKV